MLSGCGGNGSATAPPGDDADADGAEPGAYSVRVDAAPAGEAPFAITGSRASVDADADNVPVQLTLTSSQHLLLDDVRWRYVDDERDPDLAVAGPHCGLRHESDHATIPCEEMGRYLLVRPDEPLREELTVFLPATDPVGTYDYIQPVQWWRIAANTSVPPDVEDQPVDGRVDVKVRVRVQATSKTPRSGRVEQDQSEEDSWGPLAVQPSQDGTQDALTQGTLRITDDCVFLQHEDQEVLLVWPAGYTTWDADNRTIIFEDADAGTVTLTDGTHVVSGGGGQRCAANDASREEWAADFEWVSPPAQMCLTDADGPWLIGGMKKGTLDPQI